MTTERELTARLASFFPSHRDVQVGIGDDAAVVRQRHKRVVMCCDPVIAGVHFTPDTDLVLVGKKAVNRNLSDLAAMGAVADWLLVSLILPRGTSQTELNELLCGIRSAAVSADCYVVGGDVATSPGQLVVTVSAYGHVPGRALTRAGGRAGNTLHVSGPLGGSIHGHHLRFRPALAAGVWLAQQAAVTAALDVSDGLLLDLQTMLIASSRDGNQLGAEIDASAIPIRPAARLFEDDKALQHALGDGEDHVLLWSQRAGQALPPGGPLSNRSRRAIGRVTKEPGLWLVQNGERLPLPAVGFQHTVQRSPRSTRAKKRPRPAK